MVLLYHIEKKDGRIVKELDIKNLVVVEMSSTYDTYLNWKSINTFCIQTKVTFKFSGLLEKSLLKILK